METKIYEINTSRMAKFSSRHPLVAKEDLPREYKLTPISIRADEVKKFSVIFFHRLLRKIYGNPSDVEYETVKELEDGRAVGIGKEWKYFLQTVSGGLIQVGTQDYHTSVSFWHIVPATETDIMAAVIEEGKVFINDLLAEAERQKDQILNPKREFEKGEGVQLYLLHNVYLYNYGSAELLRSEFAEENEEMVRFEALRYDARTEDRNDPVKHAHIDRYILGLGMFYAAAISYYFMALEGFVNLIYHAFLRDELREKEFNLEQRFDLEQKLRLMFSLCLGFKKEEAVPKLASMEDFKQLKNYRNQIFHSKIEDALKDVGLVEHGFLYRCDMKRDRSDFLPSEKAELTADDVLKVKNTVDKIVNETLEKMEYQYRELVENFILKSLDVPFWKNPGGRILLGRSKM